MKRLMVSMCVLGATLSAGTTLAAPGEPDPGFGTAGVVTGGLLDTFGALDADSSQPIVAGTTGGQAAIARYTAAGLPDTGFSGDGRVELGLTGTDFQFFDVRTLTDGSTLVAGVYRTLPTMPFNHVWFTAKVSSTGALDGNYGTGGVTTAFGGYTFLHPDGAIAPDGSITIAFQASGGNAYVEFNAAGVESTTTGPSIDATLPAGCVGFYGYALRGVVRPAATQEIHVGLATYACTTADQERVVLTSQTVGTDTVNWSVMLPLSETAEGDDGMAIDLVGSDIMFDTLAGGAAHVHRYTTAGAPVGSWGAGGVATLAAGFGDVGGFTALAGGRVGVVNDSSFASPSPTLHIDRLLSNGAVDSTFPRVSTPMGANLTATDIVGAADGGVLVTTQTASTGALRRYDGGPVSSSALESLTPGRLMDTREGQSTVDGLFAGIGVRAANSVTELQVGGRGGVPADAEAVVLNVTVTAPVASGFITVYPCGEAVPTTSNLNFVAGDTVANAVVVKMGTGGRVCLFAAESATHLIADVNGFFPAGSGFESLSPGRLLDSREGQSTVDGQFAGIGVRAANSVTELLVGGRGGVPADADAVVLNVTVTGATGNGFITVFPCGEPLPTASNLNFVTGDTVPNAVIVKVGAGGRVCLFAAESATHLIADVNGYFPAGSGFESLSPGRLMDSREGQSTVDGQFAGIGVRA
ncbi:MAG TPA: hypothetical protein VNO51_12040, partial [Ilumatobacteraceae bacterium]|nr:hypothetical protein [Ilumatobacteraceae bacterium]